MRHPCMDSHLSPCLARQVHIALSQLMTSKIPQALSLGLSPTFLSHKPHFKPAFRSMTLCQVLSGGRQRQFFFIYGTTLRLPVQYFCQLQKKKKKLWDLTSFTKMAKMTYSLSEQNKNNKVYLCKHLEICLHVFICDITKSHALQPPYCSLFKVASNHKFFTARIKNEEQNISSDRLNPAILEDTYLEVPFLNSTRNTIITK